MLIVNAYLMILALKFMDIIETEAEFCNGTTSGNVWRQIGNDNFAYSKALISETTVKEVFQCANLCHKAEQCMGFNVERDVTDRYKRCQLVSKMELDESKMTSMPGFTYYTYGKCILANDNLEMSKHYEFDFNPHPSQSYTI